jgi:hypothetical protein
VNVVEQAAVPAVSAGLRSHPEPSEKLTWPLGVEAVPPSVSATFAVQSVEESTGTESGEQVTVVLVARVVPVTVVVPELEPWLASPA